jgi:copper chaperone CopZ
MRIFNLFALLFVALILSTAAMAQNSQDSKFKEAKIKTSAICDECKDRIEKAVHRLDGIESANLDVNTKILTVKYDSDDTDIETIRKAVNKAGYDADDQPSDKKAYKKLPACCQKDGHSH